MATTTSLCGAGLGLRRPLMGALAARPDAPVDFLEVAPENWLGVGGADGRRFAALAERYPVVCHGLSLSLGGPAPLDEGFLRRLRAFMQRHHMPLYSEHLSYCHDGGHLYELLPLPFTEEAARYIAARITRTQEVLGRRIAVENVSYYAAQPGEMDEGQFIAAVLAEADCDLLLDVNNLYVNAVNHGLDAGALIAALPPERVAYIHVAGHYREADDLIIDTHGATVVDPVWALLEQAYAHLGPLPTLLERDFNLPPLEELLTEVEQITARQHRAEGEHRHARQAHA